ncbi:GtrA family protein [Lampropedia puyangensis]|uniref:GtrA family protein n=1 Tax=Lampropedia puyangensis TaxID=1330072 RepID=A0A4S8FA03_9BURK|nr:GtrA family protein [Lampropedia puyangensis]THU04428.1 GtrA family protein [Lampropedia puyangensis]
MLRPASTIVDTLRQTWHRHATLFKDLSLAGASFALDLGLFALFLHLSGHVVVSVIFARLLSALFNFIGNRVFVFKGAHHHALRTQLIGYVVLAVAMMLASAAAVQWLVHSWQWPAVPTKAGVDVLLYIASFAIRSTWLFRLQPHQPHR